MAGGTDLLAVRKNDLIVLQYSSGAKEQSPGWFYGENVRTSRKGDFQSECVHIIPILSSPSQDLLVFQLFEI